MKITTNVRDFRYIIEDALIFASKDDGISKIHGGALERHGDELLAISTDRFRFGISATAVTFDSDDAWSTWIPYEQLRKLHATVKTFGTRENRVDIEVTIEDVAGTVTVTFPGIALSWPTEQSELPDWRPLLNTTGTGDTARFNPGYLLDFGRVSNRTGKNKPPTATMHMNGPAKPARITLGNYFVGLLMPVKPNEQEQTLFDRLMEGTN